ncbi:TPA: hypothetical protein ACH3X1_010313 [Trebouxia sp. C0004]
MCMITCHRFFSPAANISSQTYRPLNFAGRRVGSASKRCNRPGRGVQGCKYDHDQTSINQIEAPGVASPTASELHLQHAQDVLRKQQQQDSAPVPLPLAKSLVETAMLAAVSGLAFTLATLLSLESYLGYFLPMPVIVAAMRSGPAAGRKTMTATCFLLLCKLRLLVGWNSMHIYTLKVITIRHTQGTPFILVYIHKTVHAAADFIQQQLTSP